MCIQLRTCDRWFGARACRAQTLQTSSPIRHCSLHSLVSLRGGTEIHRVISRDLDPICLKQAREVVAPRDGDGYVADRVLHEKIPSDYPREQLTETGVGIRIRRACDRDLRGELRVAQRGKAACYRCKNEQQYDSRP